jgi:parvulin-like peptidyl-prolyl cis-trans isomerase-like protein
MWLLNVLVVAIGITFSLLQSPASEQISSREKPNQAAEPQVSSAPAKPERLADFASAVAEGQAVITIRGLCTEADGSKGQPGNSCSKQITRKDFERLMNALNPGGQTISTSGRQNLAQAYVEALAFADAARKAGTEDTEEFREVMFWVRLRTVADLYRRNLQEKYRNPEPAEIDRYYQEHIDSFERVHLLRILVPRENSSGGDKNEFDKKALAAAQVARAQAVSGEALEQIQKDVYAGLRLEQPPATDLGTYQRADFLEKEAADVFSLQPGEVSPLETEIKSYVIYKVASKETLKEDQVKADIIHEIAQQKYRDALKAVMDSAQANFNEQYFGRMTPKPPMEAPIIPRRPAH